MRFGRKNRSGCRIASGVTRPPVGRAGVSQLSNIRLTELIAKDQEQFIEIAAGLARDLPRLAELRATLRQRMAASPLCDQAGFARDIEAAYRMIWRTWCEALV